jgi:hypothetical protein
MLTPLAEEPGHLPVYNWYPARLARANASAELLSFRLRQHVAAHPSLSVASLKSWINDTLVVPMLGITDAQPDELAALVGDPVASINTFAAIISLRAHIGWSTHGHSAVDVNIYSSGGPGTEVLRGNVENTDIGRGGDHARAAGQDDGAGAGRDGGAATGHGGGPGGCRRGGRRPLDAPSGASDEERGVERHRQSRLHWREFLGLGVSRHVVISSASSVLSRILVLPGPSRPLRLELG